MNRTLARSIWKSTAKQYR